MNYITAAKNTKKLSETELKYNISGKASWHYQYKDSAWIYIGGLPYDLTEGDIICVFSQYGEVVNLNLPRDQKTGKSKGFCFLCYEDQRSTILAVDNLNTIKLCGRIIRVDHVQEYKVPKNIDKLDEEALKLLEEGCGPDSSVTKSVGGPSKSEFDAKTEFESLTRNTDQSDCRPRDDSSYHEDAVNSHRSKRHEESELSKRRGRKYDDREHVHDRKHREEKTRTDETHQTPYEKKWRNECTRNFQKQRPKNYDKTRHEEGSRHRNRSRSRSRDRDGRHRP